MKLEYILLVYLLSSIITWFGMRVMRKHTGTLDYWHRFPERAYATIPLLPVLNTILAVLYLYWFAVEYRQEKNKTKPPDTSR